MVLLFRSAIFRSVFFNTLVMMVVSLPTKVTVALLRVVMVICPLGVVILLGGWVVGCGGDSGRRC